MPRVSVVIPAFNAERFLKRALDSVKSQGFTDYEILVVDDGSSDGTAEVARAFEGLTLISQANRGQAAARNVGIERAEGEFVAFLDADDEWLPEKLERQLEFMRERSSRISFTDTYYAKDGERRLYSEIAPPADGEIFNQLLHQSFITTNTVLAETQLLRSWGGFSEDPDYRWHEDYELWLRLAEGGVHFDYLGEPLAIYYAGHESWSSNEVRMYQEHAKTLETFRRHHPLKGGDAAVALQAIWNLKVAAANALMKERRFREAAEAWREIPRLNWKRRLKWLSARALSRLSRG